MRSCLASTGWCNETEVNGHSDQTSYSPWNTDSYPRRRDHSDLNSNLIVCFPPEGSVQQGTNTNSTLLSDFSTRKLALLNFLAFQTQRQRPGFPIQLWVGVYFLIIWESGWHFFQDSQLFFRVLLRFYPTMVPAYQCSVLEFSGLEGTNLIDFFPPALSPLTVRGLSG